MYKHCIPFPSEYQHEYTEKKIDRLEPIRPVEDWETTISDKPKLSEKSEALANKLILDRYKTAYQIQFDREILDRYAREKEEKDLGSELVNYIRNLYNNPHTEERPRVLYTTARIFGYASPKTLHCDLSSYQDVYGRTGGQVMLQNLQKVIASKRRRMMLSKLEANLGISELDSNADQCKS